MKNIIRWFSDIYTRDPFSVVEREHREFIDENTFLLVKTRFSDEGEELILYCDFARFTDSGYETDVSLHDEELAGKTFLKLEKEDGKIKVTYEGKDGGQMKEYTMTGQ